MQLEKPVLQGQVGGWCRESPQGQRLPQGGWAGHNGAAGLGSPLAFSAQDSTLGETVRVLLDMFFRGCRWVVSAGAMEMNQ